MTSLQSRLNICEGHTSFPICGMTHPVFGHIQFLENSKLSYRQTFGLLPRWACASVSEERTVTVVRVDYKVGNPYTLNCMVNPPL
jgi:hypothetical protein